MENDANDDDEGNGVDLNTKAQEGLTSRVAIIRESVKLTLFVACLLRCRIILLRWQDLYSF